MPAPGRPGISPPALGRWAVLGAALVALGGAAWYLQATIPRRIVLASGLPDGRYHEVAQQYREILARDGVRLEERLTAGAEENERLLNDPTAGVDVALMQGGVVRPEERGQLVMLASLYYEPLWVFYRGSPTLTQLAELHGKRIAIGRTGSGVRTLATTLLAANGVTETDAALIPLSGRDAVRVLKEGQVDVAVLVGSTQMAAVQDAIRDAKLKLMSFPRAEAYARRFPYVKTLTLPPGAVDLARGIPDREVRLIGTKAMLVARDELPAALIDLLLDAAREVHAQRGLFEVEDEFPNTAWVDLPVSAEAISHLRYGPSLLHRYLPFFIATYVERLVILLVPLLFLLAQAFNLLPRFLGWRARSRIYRSYGELMLLERDVAQRTGPLPVAEWLADLDRIEQAASRVRTSASHASEAYTLREHIGLVRRAVQARAAGGD